MDGIDDDGEGSQSLGRRQNGRSAARTTEIYREVAGPPVTPDELRPNLAVVSEEPLIRYVEEEEHVRDESGSTHNMKRRKSLTIKKLDWKLATAVMGSAVAWAILKIFGRRD